MGLLPKQTALAEQQPQLNARGLWDHCLFHPERCGEHSEKQTRNQKENEFKQKTTYIWKLKIAQQLL